MAKRFAELFNLQQREGTQAAGRSYQVSDMDQIASFGTTSGYLAVLVLALYINSEKSLELYPQPEFLWGLCVLLLYGLSRIWILTRRGQMNEDPVIFALRDKVSYMLALIGLGFLLVATLPGFQ